MRGHSRIKLLGVAAAALALVLTLAVPDVLGYCLSGLRWADGSRPAKVYYNASGKLTSGQCINSSQMDGAITGAITDWKPLNYGGATTKTANKRDGVNVVGWAKLGGQTLGITNFLTYDRYRTVPCGGNLFANLYETDVRISTSWRWTSSGGQCPCAAGSAIYLDSVATHEFGHVTGLCHVNSPKALMYPSVGVCDHKAKTQDETAGENALCY